MPRLWLWLCMSVVLASACSDSRITGPQAKALYTRYRDHPDIVARGATIIVDGDTLASENRLKDLSPNDIDSVEIIKGGRPVIRIYTRPGSRSERSAH
jgi:hypothetical protein